MASPSDRRYSQSHEWHLLDGDTLTLGITRFAVNELTDITYASMKKPGTEIKAGETVGEVESVKATSDVYSAVGGVIAEVNKALESDPSLINTDPLGKGWLVKLRVKDSSPINQLMDAASYDTKYPA